MRTWFIAKNKHETLDDAILEYMGTFPKTREQCIEDMLDAGYTRKEFRVYQINIKSVDRAIKNAKPLI